MRMSHTAGTAGNPNELLNAGAAATGSNLISNDVTSDWHSKNCAAFFSLEGGIIEERGCRLSSATVRFHSAAALNATALWLIFEFSPVERASEPSLLVLPNHDVLMELKTHR